jgi:2-amino-4-hydroxy-6-hydroxymethyldihydropteridine diphosphokinase
LDGVRVALSLGSNLGDRAAHLDHAIVRLRSVLSYLVVSQYFETEPVPVRPGASGLASAQAQPRFLNAAAVGNTSLSCRALLEFLLAVEQERGRTRPLAGAPRTLDLDLILFGDAVVTEPALEVPHPRFRERLFVLEPLAEIAPDMIDPVTGLRVTELLANAVRRPNERPT